MRGFTEMTEVFKIRVSKDKLAAMPADERALFLFLGYAANQINLFGKLTIFSSNNLTEEQPEAMLSGAQTQMLLRMAVGLLHEIWVKIITNRFLKSPIGKRYQTIDFGGNAALSELKKLFGSSNLISTIRNNFAFHHPYDTDVEVAFQRAIADNAWDGEWLWFFSQSNFNSFYYVSDVIVINGIMNGNGSGGPA
jgi:hypothetical protein